MTFELPSWLETGIISLVGDEEEKYSDPPDLTALPLNLEEQTIVKDLLYCLIGAEGTYIRSDSQGNYSAKCIMHDSTMSFVEQILPICDDFYIIRRFAEGHLAFEHGRVIHALCAALRTITSEYQQTIAKFENAKRLTPSLLLGNLQNPAEMLHQLANFINALEGKKGTPILTELHARLSTFRGSPNIRKLFTYLFQSASQPLLDFIQKWIYSGIVDDPFNEFFIEVDETISVEDRGAQYESLFWEHKFKLVNFRIPKFISMSAVNSILSAGKTIAVLTL